MEIDDSPGASLTQGRAVTTAGACTLDVEARVLAIHGEESISAARCEDAISGSICRSALDGSLSGSVSCSHDEQE